MDGKYRLELHLMPKEGWLNDPNGLCCYQNKYHVFFQYSPKDVNGGEKSWGHFLSKDMINWEFLGVVITPDCEYDKDGAYSGCAFTNHGRMEIFYTGNVKEAGDYDYIHAGRGANVLSVISQDGIHFSKKELVMTNADYPKDFTCHIRDPKVYEEDGICYMLLGGRKNQEQGALIRYQALKGSDGDRRRKWIFDTELTTEKPFGYMWECPDYFQMQDKIVVMCCPQGVERQEVVFQNKYSSGYFILEKLEYNSGKVDVEKYHELDQGFDFYAPQTFEDDRGRRILYGWAGVPETEEEYTSEPTIKEGWQHCLTLPRELILKNGKLYQTPVEEIDTLRMEEQRITTHTNTVEGNAIDIVISGIREFHTITLNQDMILEWIEDKRQLKLEFLNDTGAGRKVRRCQLKELTEIRIIKDTSLLELFINEGERVFTTKYFPENPSVTKLSFQVKAEKIRAWKLRAMNIHYE